MYYGPCKNLEVLPGFYRAEEEAIVDGGMQNLKTWDFGAGVVEHLLAR